MDITINVDTTKYRINFSRPATLQNHQWLDFQINSTHIGRPPY
eukprot:UN12656